jgi:alkylhydroperoxidase family enzyme
LAALTDLAVRTARSGHAVTPDDFARARADGASDREIHDAVLVASTFSLYNRYVTALGAPEPEDPSAYGPMGVRLAQTGYA